MRKTCPKNKRLSNAKPLAYYFYVKTKTSVELHICISVPLMENFIFCAVVLVLRSKIIRPIKYCKIFFSLLVFSAFLKQNLSYIISKYDCVIVDWLNIIQNLTIKNSYFKKSFTWKTDENRITSIQNVSDILKALFDFAIEIDCESLFSQIEHFYVFCQDQLKNATIIRGIRKTYRKKECP